MRCKGTSRMSSLDFVEWGSRSTRQGPGLSGVFPRFETKHSNDDDNNNNKRGVGLEADGRAGRLQGCLL